jgi:plasmid replication initiation protein
MENIKKMTYNPEHYTVVANDIIKGKQKMTLQVARLIRLLITQVVKEDKDLRTYSCRITELADFLGITRFNLYRDIKGICESALKSIVYINTGNPKQPWKMFHWVSYAEYDGNGTIMLKLSDEIKPYILDLDKWFTQYKLKNILQFTSFYAIRLYELLTCESGVYKDYKNKFKFDMDYLKEFFGCQGKYKKVSQFKEKVIEVAIREINQKSDMYIYPEYLKTGKAISHIEFELHNNENNRYNKFLEKYAG